MKLFKISAIAMALWTLPAQASLLIYDLQDFTQSATRTLDISLTDRRIIAQETVSSAATYIHYQDSFGGPASPPRYRIVINDEFLPFDLDGATFSFVEQIGPTNRLTSAAGEIFEWAAGRASPKPDWLLTISDRQVRQSSFFKFDADRQISNFSVFIDHDGDTDSFGPTRARYANTMGDNFSNGISQRIDGVQYNNVWSYSSTVEGANLRFALTVNPVPLPAGLPMLATAFGLLLALRRKTRA